MVRHGLMLVGPTISGKTKCYEVGTLLCEGEWNMAQLGAYLHELKNFMHFSVL